MLPPPCTPENAGTRVTPENAAEVARHLAATAYHEPTAPALTLVEQYAARWRARAGAARALPMYGPDAE